MSLSALKPSARAERLSTATTIAPPTGGAVEMDDGVDGSDSWLARLYPSLGHRAFRVYWLGMLPATMAWQMSVVATGYVTYAISGSATALGLVTMSAGLPMLLLGLVGGVVADRLPRRTVLIVAQAVMAAASAALAVLMLGGWLEVWHMVVIGVVQGVSFAFQIPARQALAAELVPRRLLRNAVALNNAGMNFCRVAGPSVGGLLLAIPVFGASGVFLLMMAMSLAVIASLVWLGPSLPPRAPAPVARGGSVAQLLEGLGYIRGSPVLLVLLGLAFGPLFFGMSYLTLMPVFAEQVFGEGAVGLGVLLGASGLGALVGSVVVAGISTHPRLSAVQLAMGVGFGLALVGFALAPSYPVALVMLVLAGITSSAYGSLNSTLLISHTDPRLHGRVMSVYMLTFAAIPIAALPAAWVADLIGVQATVAATGVIVVLLVGGVALLYPPARRIR